MSRGQRCFGRFNVAVKLNQHLLLRQVLQHLELTVGHIELVLGIRHREPVRLQRQRVDQSFCHESLTTLNGELCLPQVLFGNRLLAQDRLLFCLKDSVEILLPRDLRLLEVRFRGRKPCLGRNHLNLLFFETQIELGGIELNQFVAFLYSGSFVDHPEDCRPRATPRLDLAKDFDVATTLDFTLLEHDVVEWPTIGHLSDQLAGIHASFGTGKELVADGPDHSDEDGTDQKACQHSTVAVMTAREQMTFHFGPMRGRRWVDRKTDRIG